MKRKKRRKTVIEMRLVDRGISLTAIAQETGYTLYTVIHTLDRKYHNEVIQDYIAGLFDEEAEGMWGIDYGPIYKKRRFAIYQGDRKIGPGKTPTQLMIKEKGITYKAIADATGIHANYIFMYLKYRVRRREIQDKIAAFVGIEPERLWGTHYAPIWRRKERKFRLNRPPVRSKHHIKKALGNSKITCTAIASQLGITKQMVSMVVLGRYRHETVQNEIARQLGEDPAELWGHDYAPYCKQKLREQKTKIA